MVEVARGMGVDHRIGQSFCGPGLDSAGRAFRQRCSRRSSSSPELGLSLPSALTAVIEVNELQKLCVVGKLEQARQADIPRSWASRSRRRPITCARRYLVAFAARLQAAGAVVSAYDRSPRSRWCKLMTGVRFAPVVAVALAADACILVTSWFGELGPRAGGGRHGRTLFVHGCWFTWNEASWSGHRVQADLVGGEGTRLRPLTSTIPKPVVVGWPLIVHARAVRRAVPMRRSALRVADGVRRVVRRRVGNPLGIRLHYVEEPRPLGTGGALKLAEHADDRFWMLNGDILTDSRSRRTARADERNGRARQTRQG